MLPMIRKRFLPGFDDEFFGRNFLDNFPGRQTGVNIPAVNVLEEDKSFKIEVAAPGLEKEDFKIDLDRDILTISSEKKDEKKEENKKFMRKEFSYTSFNRSFTLPESVDSEKIDAKHKDGILEIILPKKDSEIQKPAREINIS